MKDKSYTATDAVLEVYNPKNREVAAKMAHNLLKKPHVYSFYQEYYERVKPNHLEDLRKLNDHAIALALQSGDLNAVTKLLATLADMSGVKAPKETHNKTLKASIKLPGSE